MAQGRALFPDRLAGRGVTAVNMAHCLGLTVLGAAVYVRSRDSATASS